MADSHHGQGRTPSTEAQRSSVRGTSKRAPCYGRRCSVAASRSVRAVSPIVRRLFGGGCGGAQ
eukprot:9098955-Alexandrium_andersonii.AAC.1